MFLLPYISNAQFISSDDKLHLGAGAVIAASIGSPNPVTIGSAIHLLTEIYENC